VDRAAPESGTARSLIQTSAEALRFPAGTPKPQYLDPSSLRMPAAARRRLAAASAYLRRRDRWALGSRTVPAPALDQRWQVRSIPYLVQGSRKRAGEASQLDALNGVRQSDRLVAHKHLGHLIARGDQCACQFPRPGDAHPVVVAIEVFSDLLQPADGDFDCALARGPFDGPRASGEVPV
jgi:hypothetical protein